MDWSDDCRTREDREFKITEFDYENYLDPVLLKQIDTNSDEFKNLVKTLNLCTETRYERL